MWEDTESASSWPHLLTFFASPSPQARLQGSKRRQPLEGVRIGTCAGRRGALRRTPVGFARSSPHRWLQAAEEGTRGSEHSPDLRGGGEDLQATSGGEPGRRP